MRSTVKAQYAVLVALRAALNREQQWKLEMAARLRLGTSDLDALFFLLTQENCTVGDLRTCSGLTSGATTAMLDRLEKAGYLKRQAASEDRRKVLVLPNRKKLTKVQNALEQHAMVHLQIIEGFGLEELAILRAFLGQVATKK